MEFTCLTVGPLETNCYIIWDHATPKAAIIDPGGDRDRILRTVSKLGLSVERILLTHGHPDHAFLAGDLAARLNARVGMHHADLMQLTEGLGIAEVYYDVSDYVSMTPDDFFADGEKIALGDS